MFPQRLQHSCRLQLNFYAEGVFMNRTLARAIESSLVLVVSFTTSSLVFAQTAGSQAAEAPSAQTTSQAQSAPENQPPAPTPPQESSPSNHQPPVELPENPGRSNTTGQNPAAPASAQSPAQQKPEPNGTAVAPQIETSGGAASKPAGVALAPPKQRRVRSLLIKLGILAGAGVAIGTVAGLSAASPSHVPNSPGH